MVNPNEFGRSKDRMSIPSVDFAQRLYAILSPHLPEFPYPTSAKRPAGAVTRAAHSLNSNIRVYKYSTGQYFGPHYDDTVRDAATGAKSEWTILIYLTGTQDGVEGGEVRSGTISSQQILHYGAHRQYFTTVNAASDRTVLYLLSLEGRPFCIGSRPIVAVSTLD